MALASSSPKEIVRTVNNVHPEVRRPPEIVRTSLTRRRQQPGRPAKPIGARDLGHGKSSRMVQGSCERFAGAARRRVGSWESR
jgi:hypothetical protein